MRTIACLAILFYVRFGFQRQQSRRYVGITERVEFRS